VGVQEGKTGDWTSGELELGKSTTGHYGGNEVSHPGTGLLVAHTPPGERKDVGVTIALCPQAVTMKAGTALDPHRQRETEVGGTVWSQQAAAGRQGGDEKATRCDQGNPVIAVMAAPAPVVLRLDAQEDVGMTVLTGVESIAVAAAPRQRYTG